MSNDIKLPVLQRLTPAQVIIALEDNDYIFVLLPFHEGGRALCFRIAVRDYPRIKTLLEQDPDKEDAETFFYLDINGDLVLDPNAEL